jgi:hypothetical protein
LNALARGTVPKGLATIALNQGRTLADGRRTLRFLRQILSDRQNLRYTSGFAERMPECPRPPQGQSIS